MTEATVLPRSARVLVLLTGAPEEEELFDYALGLGRRMEAGVDLLWLSLASDGGPAWATFRRKATLAGVDVALIRGAGGEPWDEIQGYVRNHRPPMAMVLARDAIPLPREETMTRYGPVILVNRKPSPEPA